METVKIQGVEVTLAWADEHDSLWVDYFDYARLLEAAWLQGSPPSSPR